MATIEYRNDIVVEFIDAMGHDSRVSDSARVSTRTDRNQRPVDRLVKWLVGEGHWSPLQHVYITVRAEMPISTARQLMRHHSHNFNEESGRYSEMLPHFYLPDVINPQDEKNKQVRNQDLVITDSDLARGLMKKAYEHVYATYKGILGLGSSREQARDVLPLGMYTRLYATANLRDMLFLIKERVAWDAQPEIQQYAQQVLDILREVAPVTVRKFMEEHMNPVKRVMEKHAPTMYEYLSHHLEKFSWLLPGHSDFAVGLQGFQSIWQEVQEAQKEWEELLNPARKAGDDG